MLREEIAKLVFEACDSWEQSRFAYDPTNYQVADTILAKVEAALLAKKMNLENPHWSGLANSTFDVVPVRAIKVLLTITQCQ